jgi:hypothetical protein
MRHRRWVVVLAVLIIGVLPLSFLGLEVASRHPVVKRAVLSRIMPVVAGELSIGELEMGLASLQFTDISLELDNGGLILIPSASVNLSYAELITGGLAPERSLSSVIVSSPRVVVNYGGPAKSTEDDAAPFDVASLEAYLPEYLGISDATLVFRDVRTGRVLTVDSIDLLLERRGDEPVTGGASGSCLGGERNLQAEFTWDSDKRCLSVSGELTSARLGDGLPVPPTLPVDLTGGVMGARFHASAAPDSIVGLDLEFEVEGAALAALSFGEELTDISARGRLADDVLTIEAADGAWRSAYWSARGSLVLGTGVIEDLVVEGRGVPVRPVLSVMGEDADASGEVDLVARLGGRVASPVADVRVSNGNVRLGGLSLGDVSCSTRASADSFAFADFRASVMGGEVRAGGALVRGAPDSTWTFRFEGGALGMDVRELAAYALGDTGWGGTVALTDLVVEGTLEDPYLESMVAWRDVSAGRFRLGSGAGGFMLGGGMLSASLQDSGRTFVLSGVAEDLDGAAEVTAELGLRGFELGRFMGAGEGPAIVLDGAVTAGGRAEALELAGSMAASGDRFSATVGLEGGLELRGAGPSRLEVALASTDAAVNGVALPFEADVSVDAERLRLSSVEVGDFCRADLALGFDETEGLSGGIVVSEAVLPDVLRAAFGESPAGVDGLVFASISLGGTVAEPAGTAQVQIGSAEAFGVSGLDAAGVVSFGGGALELRELEVRESGRVFATAGGTVSGDGEVAATVTGSAVPGPFLGGGRDTEFELSAGIGGQVGELALDGFVRSEDGEFLGISFDSYTARFTAAEGIFNVDQLILERDSAYRASATAVVPYAALSEEPEGEGTLSIDVTGDPVALLAEILGAETSGEGRGSMSALLVGNRSYISVADARLEALADHFVPQGLFERVDDLEASVAVRDGSVVSGEITGRVGGSLIRLGTERPTGTGDRELEPLVVGGVDCGVLTLSTDDRGVMTNVPGMMLPDERGRIALRGKDGEPGLLIAGPAERPFIWGEMEFSDLSFTYPFIESDEGSPVGDLLSDADWSLRMTAGRNLWYWRPDANLNVERGGSLDFVGVPSEHTMCVSGRVISNRGTVTYLHTDFDVKEVFVDFPSFCEPPMFRIEAETRVADGTTITLSMQTTEDTPMLSAPGVTLDESALVLSSDSPDDNTPEKIMSKLQYGVSPDLIEAEEQAVLERRRAVELIGTQIGLRVARPLLAPIEARIRRGLNLDLVRIDIDFVEHFLSQMDMWSAQEGTAEYVPFVADTRMTLGKYISRDWMLSYLGVVEPFEEEVGGQVIGLRSEFGIEYEVSRNTSLSLRVVYDPALAGWDRRISIENRYEF